VQPINDNVIKPISDAIDQVVDIFENIANFIADGQFEQKFSVVDIDEEWDFKVDAGENATGDNTTILSLAVKGHAKVDVSLNAKLRINYAYIGATAEYSIGSTLAASAGKKRDHKKEKELWKGEKYSRIVVAIFVPVEVYAQPALKLDAKASVSLTQDAEVGFSARGGTSSGVAYDGDVKPEVIDPYNKFDPIWPTLEGTATFSAGAGIVLSVEAGLYGGLASATIGLRLGLDMKVAGSVTSVGDDVLPTIDDFDLSLGLSIPLSAKFVYGAFLLKPGSPLWEKKWTIITLPSVRLELLDDHRCVLGNNGTVASFSLKAESSYPDALIDNPIESAHWYSIIDGWSTIEKMATEISFEKTELGSVSPQPKGNVTIVMQPRIPPLLKVIQTVSLDSLFPADSVQCTDLAPCDGDEFFDKLTQSVGAEFNSEIFLSQPPDPNAPLVPSSVYKFEDFMAALKKLQSAGEGFQFWLGDDCSIESQKASFVNMAAFLGQAMRETIIYDACDENNWDKWRADIFKEPSSPPENLAALYPMSSGCGQLGQKYAEHRCDDECPQDLTMEITATTNAAWIGAPPPLFCGPRSTYDGLGYWNPQQFCSGPSQTCVGEPFYYEGQTAGVHVPVS
jgi:hypothetical protein